MPSVPATVTGMAVAAITATRIGSRMIVTMITDPIGREDGYYFLCVIAGNAPSFDSSWQQPSYASTRFKRLDSQPPLVLLDYELEALDQVYRLSFQGGDGGPPGWVSSWRKGGRPDRRIAPIRRAIEVRSRYRT